MSAKKQACIATFTIIAILIVDQGSKILVKTNMTLGESIPIFGNWFQICFTENPGFAFGMQFGGEWGKLALTLFRIIAVGVITWLLIKTIKQQQPTGLIMGIAVLLAGAFGNIIDCVFYGQIFSDSYGVVATMFPEGGGYAPLLHGRVVDMLYFPIIDGTLPNWIPFWGGEHFTFFQPIFNIADSAISVSIVYMLLFQRKTLAKLLK